jgi:hypothetical protein
VVEVTEVVSVAIVMGMGSPVMAMEVAVTVVDGTEAVTGEDAATTPITPTEDMAIPTSVITPTTIPITLTGIGLPSVIPMGGVGESGSHSIIKGKKN